jgi:colanic acid biosynthesis glycosyl transferase WcaI
VEKAQAGLTVPPDDPDAFSAALLTLLDGRDQRAEMGASGRAFVERWASPGAVAASYEDLFLELARPRSRQGTG